MANLRLIDTTALRYFLPRFLAVFIGLTITMTLSGQVSLGFYSGGNYSSVERGSIFNTDTNGVNQNLYPASLGQQKIGSAFGLFLRNRLSRKASFQAGLGMTRIGMYNQYEELNANLDYLSIPLTAELNVFGPIHLTFGAEPRLLLAQENWGGLVPENNDFALLAGVHWDTPIVGLGLSARYSAGNADVVRFNLGGADGEGQGYRNSAVSIAVQYDPFARLRSFRSKPPVLRISGMEFVDQNNNGALDATEKTSLEFNLHNDGFGLAEGLIVEVVVGGDKQGVDFERRIKISSVIPGKQARVSIPLTAHRSLLTGSLSVMVSVIEPNGFNPNNSPMRVEIPTTEYAAPKLEVVDFDIPDIWKTNERIAVGILVQNTGAGPADKVELSMTTDKLIFQDPLELTSIKTLLPGESQALSYDFMVPRSYRKSEVRLELEIEEKYGDYSKSWVQSFPLVNSSQAQEVLKIERSDSLGNVSIAALPKEILFNEFERADTVSRIFVCPNVGSDCLGAPTDGEDVASYAESLLLGDYDILERRHFETVLQEQRLAASGLVFEESAVELGCNEGSQGILFVEEGCTDGKSTITLKLVGCKTSEIYWTCLGRGASAFEVISRVKQELSN